MAGLHGGKKGPVGEFMISRLLTRQSCCYYGPGARVAVTIRECHGIAELFRLYDKGDHESMKIVKSGKMGIMI